MACGLRCSDCSVGQGLVLSLLALTGMLIPEQLFFLESSSEGSVNEPSPYVGSTPNAGPSVSSYYFLSNTPILDRMVAGILEDNRNLFLLIES